MAGLFPELANGAVVIRDMSGVCTGTLEAPNAYCPPASFTSSCAITALSEDCVSRIKPSQINALVSELLCLAYTLTPEGNWDCLSNCNLAQAFTDWAAAFTADSSTPVDNTTIGGGTNAADPIHVLPVGTANLLVGNVTSRTALANGLNSTDLANILTVDANGRLFASADFVVTDICAQLSTRLNLVNCQRLNQTWNILEVDPVTGQFYVSPSEAATKICADVNAPKTLSNCLVSGDAFNSLQLGADGKLYVIGSSALSPDFLQGGLLSSAANVNITAQPFSAKKGTQLAVALGAITKNINGTWAPGTGVGGLDTGVKAASTTYYVYSLRKTADGSAEMVLSTSPTVAGVNTSLLTGYTVMDQMGVFVTDASVNIRPFFMYPNDKYLWASPIRDASFTATATSVLTTLPSLPTGQKVLADLRFMWTSTSSTSGALVSDPAQGVLVAGSGADGLNAGIVQAGLASGTGTGMGADEIWTNIAGQVRCVAGASGTLQIWTDGFTYPVKGRIL